MSWWQWLVAAVGALLVGISKTGFAGLGALAAALFSSALPPREAVGNALVVLIAGDLVAVSTYRRQADWPSLLRLAPWTVAGVLLGVLALRLVDDLALKRLIGALLVVMVGVQLWNRRRAAAAVPRYLAPLAGVLAGFSTMVANAAGPVMTIYLLAMALPKTLFMGTAAWFFFAVNLFKLPFSIGLGMIRPETLPFLLPLLPLTVLGALSGRWLLNRVDQRLFENLALVLTLLAGVRLLV